MDVGKRKGSRRRRKLKGKGGTFWNVLQLLSRHPCIKGITFATPLENPPKPTQPNPTQPIPSLYWVKGLSFPPLPVTPIHFCSWKMTARSLLKPLPFHLLHLLPILLILVYLQLIAPPITTFSQPLPSNPPPSQSPTPSPSLHTSPTSRTHHHLRQVLLGLLLGCITGFTTSLLFIFLIRHCLFFVNQTPVLKGPVVFSPNINPRVLHSALSNSQATNLVGSGAHGTYIRATLDDGLLVAIKLVESSCFNGSPAPPEGKSAKRKVQQWLEILALVNHRNVMSLRAYVCEQERLSLVYDYLGSGSLEDAMKRVRSNQMRLGWDVRHKIAVGIVRGLRYLHFECNPRILHYDLKPSNVLLDEEFEPKLADSGLVKLLSGGGGGDGDVGEVALVSNYMAPECLQICRYTDKSDIYSFGVILGMLLSGKDPSDAFFSGEHGSLGRWMRNLQQRGEAHEALDKAILGEECEEDEMMMAIRIVIVCLSDLPADRPSSDELVAMLTQLHSF